MPSLPGTRKREDVDAAQHLGVVGAAVAREDHAVRDAEAPRRLLGELRPPRAPPHHEEARAGIAREERSRGFEEQVEAPVGLDARHDPDHAVVGRAARAPRAAPDPAGAA